MVITKVKIIGNGTTIAATTTTIIMARTGTEEMGKAIKMTMEDTVTTIDTIMTEETETGRIIETTDIKIITTTTTTMNNAKDNMGAEEISMTGTIMMVTTGRTEGIETSVIEAEVVDEEEIEAIGKIEDVDEAEGAGEEDSIEMETETKPKDSTTTETIQTIKTISRAKTSQKWTNPKNIDNYLKFRSLPHMISLNLLETCMIFVIIVSTCELCSISAARQMRPARPKYRLRSHWAVVVFHPALLSQVQPHQSLLQPHHLLRDHRSPLQNK